MHPPPPIDPTISPSLAHALGEITAELRHIQHSLAQLHTELHELRAYVGDEFNQHRDYHTRNETRWGPVRWCERHPFQFGALLLAATTIASLLRGGLAWTQLAAFVLQVTK